MLIIPYAMDGTISLPDSLNYVKFHMQQNIWYLDVNQYLNLRINHQI